MVHLERRALYLGRSLIAGFPPYSTYTNNGNSKGKTQTIPTYPVTLLWYPRMPKEDSRRCRGSYAFAEESLLPGGTSPILSAAFDDLESLSELFATADPAAAAKPVANTTHIRQISEAIPRDERPNAPNDAPNEAPVAAPQQAKQAAPRKEAQVPGRVAGPQAKETQLTCNCKTQLQCKRCQIAAVSHSRDGHSFNAKCLIPSSYSVPCIS
jgi:hypothetical protein